MKGLSLISENFLMFYCSGDEIVRQLEVNCSKFLLRLFSFYGRVDDPSSSRVSCLSL